MLSVLTETGISKQLSPIISISFGSILFPYESGGLYRRGQYRERTMKVAAFTDEDSTERELVWCVVQVPVVHLCALLNIKPFDVVLT